MISFQHAAQKRNDAFSSKTDDIPPSAVISGVCFGIQSKEQILKRSVVQVTEVNLNRGGVPQPNGLSDPRMGSSSRMLLCSTCGNNHMDCPGHPGHIVLAKPVINISYIETIRKILSCVCFNCSSLLLDKHAKLRHIHKIKSKKARFTQLHKDSQRLKFCSECETSQPVWKHEKTGVVIRPIFHVPNDCDPSEYENIDVQITPEKIVQILKYIKDDDVDFLGFHSTASKPVSMMYEVFPVPPVAMRPRLVMTTSKGGGEDDITVRLKTIVKKNKKMLERGGKTMIVLSLFEYKGSLYEKKSDIQNGVVYNPRGVGDNTNEAMEAYVDLQRSVASYVDSTYSTNRDEDFAETRSITDRFQQTGKAKDGRMRKNLIGKRLDWCGRTVVGPCTDMRVDEVGVPREICMNLTFPERVNAINIHLLTKAVRNGPDKYPGANYIIDPVGKVIRLSAVNCKKVRLSAGWTVRRHLVNGDDVLFNRQPSLHRMSLMGKRVKVMDGKTFRLHVGCTKPYNADFDGDEMNMYVCLSQYTRAEAREVLSVKNNMCKDGVMLVCLQQHAILGAYYLTNDRESLAIETAEYLLGLCDADFSDPPDWWRRDETPRVRGTDLFSFFLPKDMHLNYKGVVIDGGRMVAGGPLNKSTLNSGVLYCIYKDYSPDVACEWINKMTTLLVNYVSRVKGSTIGIDDCYHGRVSLGVSSKLETMHEYANRFVDHTPGVCLRAEKKNKNNDTIENNICSLVDKVKDIGGDEVLTTMKTKHDAGQRNGLYEIVKSGAKGNVTNIIQICSMVGQQRNAKSMRNEKIMSHSGFQNSASSHGFIASSFMQGLRSLEYFHHLVGSRVGLVDTAVKTSETGYSQRRLAKGMEDIRNGAMKTVTNEKGKIVEFCYGGDGYSSTTIESNKIRFLTMGDEETVRFYVEWACPETTRPYAERELRMIRDVKLKLNTDMVHRRRYSDVVLCPVKFDRLLLRSKHHRGGSESSISAKEVYELTTQFWKSIVAEGVVENTPKNKALFLDWLSLRSLLFDYEQDANSIRWLLQSCFRILAECAVPPNQSVGLIASQNCAEPLTQLTLNRFHKSGLVSNLQSGVARMKEIINIVGKIKAPTMSIPVKPGFDAEAVGKSMIQILGKDVVKEFFVGIDDEAPFATRLKGTPFDHVVRNRLFLESMKPHNPGAKKCMWIMLDKRLCMEERIAPRKVASSFLSKADYHKCFDPKTDITFSYSSVCSPVWWVALNFAAAKWESCFRKKVLAHAVVNQADQLAADVVYHRFLATVLIKGVRGVRDFYVEDASVYGLKEPNRGVVAKLDHKIIHTQGCNLGDAMVFRGVDGNRVTTNHIRAVEAFLGIDAARATIEQCWHRVMSSNNAHVGLRHIKLIASAMTCHGFCAPMTYTGICRESSSIIKKASYEKAVLSFVTGAAHGHVDTMSGCMDSICWNSTLQAGTGKVEVVNEPMEVPASVREHMVQQWVKKKVDHEPMAKEEMDALLRTTRVKLNQKEKDQIFRASPDREKQVHKLPAVVQAKKAKKTNLELEYRFFVSAEEMAENSSLLFVPSSPVLMNEQVEEIDDEDMDFFVPSSPNPNL